MCVGVRRVRRVGWILGGSVVGAQSATTTPRDRDSVWLPGRGVSASVSGSMSRTAEPRRQGSAPVFPVSGRERRVRVSTNGSGRAFPSPSQSPSPGPALSSLGCRRAMRVGVRPAGDPGVDQGVPARSILKEGPSGPCAKRRTAPWRSAPHLGTSRSPLDRARLSHPRPSPRAGHPHHGRRSLVVSLSLLPASLGGLGAGDAVRQRTHFKGRARRSEPIPDAPDGISGHFTEKIVTFNNQNYESK